MSASSTKIAFIRKIFSAVALILVYMTLFAVTLYLYALWLYCSLPNRKAGRYSLFGVLLLMQPWSCLFLFIQFPFNATYLILCVISSFTVFYVLVIRTTHSLLDFLCSTAAALYIFM